MSSRAAILVCLASTPAIASTQEAEPPDGLFQVFAEELVLGDLVEFWARRLDISIEFDPDALDATVTVRTPPGLTEDGFWALTNRLLVANDFACIQLPGEENLSVVPLAAAATSARIEPGAAAARAGYVRVLRPVEHVAPEDASEAVGGVLTGKGAKVQAIPAAGQVTLAALKPAVLQALEFLDAFDRPEGESVVREVAIEETTPTALVTILERVTAARKQIGSPPLGGTALAHSAGRSVILVAPPAEISAWLELVERFDHAEPAYTAHYAPRRFGLSETRRLIEEVVGARAKQEGSAWRVVTDELTGTLIITASPALHEEVRRVVERLEDTASEARWALRTIPVRNRRADDMRTLLEELLDLGAVTRAGVEEVPRGLRHSRNLMREQYTVELNALSSTSQ